MVPWPPYHLNTIRHHTTIIGLTHTTIIPITGKVDCVLYVWPHVPLPVPLRSSSFLFFPLRSSSFLFFPSYLVGGEDVHRFVTLEMDLVLVPEHGKVLKRIK